MERKRLSGSLFSLLTRGYVLFTLLLLVLGGAVFLLWNAWLSAPYRLSDWEGLLEDPSWTAGDYGKLKSYLNPSGDAFAVYDREGQLLYASADGFDQRCTPEELACAPIWDGASQVESYAMSDADGQRRFLVIHRTYDAQGAAVAEETVYLDQNYQVLAGSFGDGRTGYTPREYQYLTGAPYPGTVTYSHPAAGGDGEAVTVLLRKKVFQGADYDRRYAQSWKIWLLFLPLYLVGVGGFIFWMHRKIGRPLKRLNDAVTAQAQGSFVQVGDCGGAWEIRRIGESFDRFSRRLEASEAERRRLDQGRQKLIADISHDLKTPITVIAGYIDAICDGKVPPEETERYLRAIQSKAATLTALVEAFHEYSKVEHPEFVLSPQRTDLCEFLREYLAEKYEEIDLAGFSLEISIPETPLVCALDPLQFRRVLDNLLSNALRHNRLGTILYFDVEAAGTWAVVKVGDNGAGIPPERAKHIFEPFVVGSDARSGQGSGLGLAITRRIVEKHGGIIALNPRPPAGRSTEFQLRLPLWEQK